LYPNRGLLPEDFPYNKHHRPEHEKRWITGTELSFPCVHSGEFSQLGRPPVWDASPAVYPTCSAATWTNRDLGAGRVVYYSGRAATFTLRFRATTIALGR
jgi:hypothetical protein